MDNITNISLVGWGNENNFDRLAGELLRLFYNGYTKDDVVNNYATLDDKNKLFFNGFASDYPQCDSWEISTFIEGESIKFTEDQYKVIFENTMGVGSYNPCVFISSVEYSLNINNLVAVQVNETLSNELGLTEGVYVLPAFVYYILIKSNANQELKDVLNLAVIIAGIVTPFDEFYLLGRALQLAKNTYRVGRFSAAKILAKERKLTVVLDAKGTKLFEKAGVKLDDLVKFEKLANAVDDVFDVTKFKNAIAKTPGVDNTSLTNLPKSFWDDAYKLKPKNTSALKTKVDNIISNGDQSGKLTETLVEDIMTANEYKVGNGRYYGDYETARNGIDGFFYKGDITNPSEIVIIDAKQMKANGSVKLNDPNLSTQLPVQMTEDWFEYIANNKLTDISNPIQQNTKNAILNADPGFIQKYVVAVDKSTGEINFLKLGETF